MSNAKILDENGITRYHTKITAIIDGKQDKVTPAGDDYIDASFSGATLNINAKTQEIESATSTSDGLATAKDVKDYVDSHSGGSSEIDVIEVPSTGDVTQELQPNKFYKFTGESISSLTITFAAGTSGKLAEYMFQFYCPNDGTVLGLPDSVAWVSALTMTAGKTYQVSVVNDIALWCAAEFASPLTYVIFNPSEQLASVTTMPASLTVQDGNGDDVTLTSSGSVAVTSSTTSTLRTWTVDGVSYSYTTAKFLTVSSGSTSSNYVAIPLTGPCKITIVGYRTGNSTRYIYANIGGTANTVVTISSASTLTQGTYSYTGTGSTLYVYGSGTNTFLAFVKVDYTAA